METTIIKAFKSNDDELNEWVQRIFPAVTTYGGREEKLRMVIISILDQSRRGLTGDIA